MKEDSLLEMHMMVLDRLSLLCLLGRQSVMLVILQSGVGLLVFSSQY